MSRAWDALREADAPADARPAARRLLVPGRLVRAMSDASTLALFDAACEAVAAAGFDLVEGEVPGWLEGEQAAGVISLAESGAALAGMDLARASEGLRARAATAARLAPGTLAQARTAASALREALAATLAATRADAVITPTWPFAAPAIDAVEVEVGGRTVPVDPHRNCFVRAANAVDACALSLPMGLHARAGVPAGLHLMAPGGREDALLEIARAIEACLPRLSRALPLQEGA